MTKPRTPNDTLRRLITDARVSYSELAADVRHIARQTGTALRTNPSAVAHWVSGRPPTPATAEYVAEALSNRLGRHVTTAELGWPGPDEQNRSDAQLGLGIGPDPVDIVRRLGEADIHRRQILTTTAYSVAAAALPLGAAQAADAQHRAQRAGTGRHVGHTDLDTVREMIRAFAAIDERQGGQHGRTAVIEYLRSDVAEMCRGRFATPALRAEALTAAASLSFLAGWKAYDADEHGLAQRYHLQSLALAKEVGDPLHIAWILRLMAHKGMDIHEPTHTLDLADAALSLAEGNAEPGIMATFVICRARALGHAGRGPEAAAEIRRAQDLASRAEEEQPPYWMVLNSHPTAQVGSHAGKTLQVLRDYRNAEREYSRAARAYESCAPGLNRVVGLSLADEGTQQALQGHLEQACGTWNRAVDRFEGVYSDRAAKRVAGIRHQLNAFSRRGVKAAAHLNEKIHIWQLAHA